MTNSSQKEHLQTHFPHTPQSQPWHSSAKQGRSKVSFPEKVWRFGLSMTEGHREGGASLQVGEAFMEQIWCHFEIERPACESKCFYLPDVCQALSFSEPHSPCQWNGHDARFTGRVKQDDKYEAPGWWYHSKCAGHFLCPLVYFRFLYAFLHTISKCKFTWTLLFCWGDSYCSPTSESLLSLAVSLPPIYPSMDAFILLSYELKSSPDSSDSSLFWTTLEPLCACLRVVVKEEALSSECPLLCMDPGRPETSGALQPLCQPPHPVSHQVLSSLLANAFCIQWHWHSSSIHAYWFSPVHSKVLLGQPPSGRYPISKQS